MPTAVSPMAIAETAERYRMGTGICVGVTPGEVVERNDDDFGKRAAE